MNTTAVFQFTKILFIVEEKEDSCFVTGEELTGGNPFFSHTGYMAKIEVKARNSTDPIGFLYE